MLLPDLRLNEGDVGIFRPSPLKCQQNHLMLCLVSFYDSLYIFRRDYDDGKESAHVTVIGGELAGK